MVGCTGISIRNEDAAHIMGLVIKGLHYNKKKITDELLSIIQSVLAMDAKGADTENEISELKSVAQSIGKQGGRELRQQGLIAEITEAVQGLVDGMADSDDFYQEVLDKMVVNDKGHIDVYLKALPFKWSYMDVECAKCP